MNQAFKKSKAKVKQCSLCNKPKFDVELQICPYGYEIYQDVELVLYCGDCIDKMCDEI